MKKYLFDLQLFAEEGADPVPEVETPEEEIDNEPEEIQKPQAKYTDEDVDRIINQKFAELAKKYERKASEAERLGKMTAEEKANARMSALENKLREYEEKEARAEMAKQARVMLMDKNINVSDALLANLIADDAEMTKSSVESFITMYQAALEKAVKDAYKGETPRKGGGSAGMTKEQILAVQNRAERQRLIGENMHLFQSK